MRFNLSEWALAHRPLVLFAIVVFAFIGVLSYERLGQSEDPPFTFKVMVIRTQWPGASAREVGGPNSSANVTKELQAAANVAGASDAGKARAKSALAADEVARALAQLPEINRRSVQIAQALSEVKHLHVHV